MENLLKRYLDMRLTNEPAASKQGPVVTISRECGCPSKKLAEILVGRLSQLDPVKTPHPGTWRWISKELLEEAATDLDVKPKDIDHVFNYEERSIVDNILAASNKSGTYRTDKAIYNALGKVIRIFGENGHVVIVGRAGVALTRHIPLSIHIRLIAPVEWRINSISDMYNLSREASIKMIALKDENRRKFLEHYLGHPFQIDVFDLAINCSSYSLDEIADSIIGLMKLRKMT